MLDDHKTRTVVMRAGSGFLPAQSKQKLTAVARAHSFAGWAASN